MFLSYYLCVDRGGPWPSSHAYSLSAEPEAKHLAATAAVIQAKASGQPWQLVPTDARASFAIVNASVFGAGPFKFKGAEPHEWSRAHVAGINFSGSGPDVSIRSLTAAVIRTVDVALLRAEGWGKDRMNQYFDDLEIDPAELPADRDAEGKYAPPVYDVERIRARMGVCLGRFDDLNDILE